MLTPEQIQNLTPGDPIVINTEIHHVDKYGTIWFNARTKYCTLNLDAISPELVSLPSEHGTSVPTPTRLFKEGDKVRYCERDGRKIFRLQNGAIYEVKSNEGDTGTVEIWLWKEVGRYGSYPYNVFELVTPVEELMPYSIDPANTNVLFKHGKKFATFEDDDEAQEVCDRLNTERRKEQNND